MAAAASTTMYGGAADLISGLCDDLLLRILQLLPDASDTVRTGALSRRWRGLWTRLRSLRFSSRSSSRPAAEFSSAGGGGGGSAQAQRFVSFVNGALALRAAQTEPAVEHLAISFDAMAILRQQTFDAAQGWIRIAAQNEVKSFVLQLYRLSEYKYHHRLVSGNKQLLGKKKQPFVIDLEDLPSSSKMETMRLSLGDARVVQLPAAATFASLVYLSLENMEFADGNGHSLNRFLSTACCPRLQKLSLRELRFTGMKELLLEAEALLELFIEKLQWDTDTVRMRTPSLRVLRMVDCDIDELVLSAPMLEELLFLDGAEPFSNIDIIDGESSCIRRLKVELDAYAYRYGDDDDQEERMKTRMVLSFVFSIVVQQ